MKSKKRIVYFVIILIIFIWILAITFLFLKREKEGSSTAEIKESIKTEKGEENTIDSSQNNDLEEFLLSHNLLNKELFESQNEYDLNSTGTDWEYSDEIQESVKNTIAEIGKPIKKEPEKWEDTVTQEDIDKYKFKVIYDNMPEEVLGYIRKSYEDFDRSLKEYSYLKGFAAANEARYNYYEIINNNKTVMIDFNLNDYYGSEIGVLINLEDFSSNIFNIN